MGYYIGSPDFFTSKLATAYKDDRGIFFLIIGLDQFIHSATLVITLGYFMPGFSTAQ